MAIHDESKAPSDDELLGRSQQLLGRFARLTKVLEQSGLVIPDDAYDTVDVRRPRLHRSYTPDEAVAAFGAEPSWRAAVTYGADRPVGPLRPQST